MSEMRFPCLDCGKHLKAGASQVGRMATCPKCKAKMRIPKVVEWDASVNDFSRQSPQLPTAISDGSVASELPRPLDNAARRRHDDDPDKDERLIPSFNRLRSSRRKILMLTSAAGLLIIVFGGVIIRRSASFKKPEPPNEIRGRQYTLKESQPPVWEQTQEVEKDPVIVVPSAQQPEARTLPQQMTKEALARVKHSVVF